MTKNFYEAVEGRRSIYGLSDAYIISDERLQEVLHIAVKNAPTAFNSQTGRIVVLLEEQNKLFWEQAFDEIKEGLTEERFQRNKKRFEGFASGHGTILFFEDQKVIESFQNQFADIAEQFTNWSQQGTGILQYLVWTTLENEGFGASLQHYYPEISAVQKQKWGIQSGWKLVAELPFGSPTSLPKEKEIQPVEERVIFTK
ncbi:nitroreductase [Rummeliibacillus sp. TYF005]|uniref:nitroreductase family protein n=1 Tax=Rummeliibacillus sp. TYF005 TaxID=2058214 RepID=UPI000F547420|nr:nitroreductase family protein [Rummeliibacillus sp. TYF005]RPJ95045.1 nitroreductase [Rummeliibacillus sp. TYF005]